VSAKTATKVIPEALKTKVLPEALKNPTPKHPKYGGRTFNKDEDSKGF
jgi:hypothetical protein